MPGQLGIFHILHVLHILHSWNRRNRGNGRDGGHRGDGGILGTDANAFGVGIGDGGVETDVENGETGNVVEFLPLRDGNVARNGAHREDIDRVLIEALERESLDADRVLKVAFHGVGGGSRSGGRRMKRRRIGVFRSGRRGEKGRFGERRGEFGLGDARSGEIDGGGDGGGFEVEEILLEVDEVFVVSEISSHRTKETSFSDGTTRTSRSASNCPFRGRSATTCPPS